MIPTLQKGQVGRYISGQKFSLWRFYGHDWGPSYSGYLYLTPESAAHAAQMNYEALWDPVSRGPYVLVLPALTTSPTGAPLSYNVDASVGGHVCGVSRYVL
jgi:hypothetical protein